MSVSLPFLASVVLASVSLPSQEPAPAASPTPAPFVRVRVERYAETGGESAVVFGQGFAFWQDRVQVSVPRETLEAIARAFEEARFSEMPELLGAGRKRLRVLVERESADGTSKQVVQLFTGDQSEAIDRLAASVLDPIRPLAEGAVGPSGLEDGLRRIAAGELAPQALTLVLNRKPELSAPAGAEGFLVEVQTGHVARRPFRQGAGYGEARPLAWSDDILRKIAARLADGQLESLPGNLFADQVVTLDVRVLKLRKSIEARRFSGLTREKHGEAQSRFDTLLSDLERLLAAESPPDR